MTYKIADPVTYRKWHPFTRPTKSVSYWMYTWDRRTVDLGGNAEVFVKYAWMQ